MCKEADEAPAPGQEEPKVIHDESEKGKNKKGKKQDKQEKQQQQKADDLPEGLPPTVTKGLPEPAKPVPIPEQAVVPPQRPTKLDHTKPTIANEDVFHDQDLSSISM